MPDRFGWGVVGAGRRAREVMVPALMAETSSDVVGVASGSPENAEKAVADWPEIEVHENLDSLLEDEKVDVVYIASPHFLHVPQAVQAIEAGKHLFMESPMALSVDGAHKLLEKSRSAGVKIGVAHQYRYHSAMRLIKDKIDSGELGRIKLLSVRCAEPLTWNRGWWLDVNRSGPASLLRLGVHALDLITWLKPDEVLEVMAMGVEEGEDERINTMVTAMVRYTDNTLAYALGASAVSAPDNGVRVEGEDGRLFLEGDMSGQGNLVLHQSGTAERTFESEDPVSEMITAFTSYLAGEGEYHPDAADAKRLVEVTCATIDSMSSRKAVRIGDVFRTTG